MSVQELNEKDFHNNIETGPALIYFYADWCPSCRTASLLINKISEEQKDISFFKINVDHSKNLSAQFNIKSIPTVILFKNSSSIGRLSGIKSKKDILELLEKI
jgi:thioredoxin 1